MALKLGELLIKEGLITQHQLDEALKSQVIFGIKLGSSLIELGFVEEGKLVKLLSKKLGVPAVSRKEILNIPEEVIRAVPSAIAEKYRVIPFGLDKKRLSVAMSDPTDLKAIDEISFMTGCLVQPFIAPDLHIAFALEKYYYVIRDARYLRVSDTFRKRAAALQQEKIEVQVEKENGDLLNIEIPVEFEGFDSLPGLPEEPFYGETQAPLLAPLGKYTIDKLSMEFAAARERDDVADVFIKYLGQEFTTCALFIVRGNAAVGWRGVSAGKKISGFEEVNLLLSKPSVLRDIIEERNYFMGILINTPENRQIQKVLEIRPETPLLVLPVVMLNKVVAAVLVSADMDSLGRRVAELQKLVRKASLAFEMLILKNKILMT